MKLKVVLPVFLLAFLLLLTGCGKRAIHVSPNFIGVWVGHDGTDSYRLSIDETDIAYWQKSTGSNYETAQGSARIRDNNLYVGVRTFHIEEYPTQDPHLLTWRMVLSGVLYTR